MMDEDDNSYHGQVQTISQGMDNASSLAIRLDLAPFYEDIREFLSGYRVGVDPDTQRVVRMQTGTQMCSEMGVQSILQMMRARVNNQTVQGYMDDISYPMLVFHFRIFFSKDLMRNKRKYGLLTDNYGVICNGVCDCVQIFLSRTLYNSERNSYAKTGQVIEQHKIGGQSPSQKFGVL